MWRYFWRTAGDLDPSRTDHVSAEAWKVFPQGESEGRCDCCRSVSRLVWGEAHGAQDWRAEYSVHWTPGASKAKHPANFDILLSSARTLPMYVSMVLYDRAEGGPGVMVIDASVRPFAREPGSGVVLSRDRVLGTPLAPRVFALFDKIWLEDPRIRALA